MNVARQVAVALLAVAVLGGCPKRVEPEEASVVPRARDYYPLAVGNRWTYDATFLGQKREAVVEITREENGFFRDTQGGELAIDGFGVRDQKRYLLRDPLEPGKEWTNVVSVSSVEHYKVIEAGASCEVPAGRYEACVRIEGRNRVDEKTTLVNEMTFAPGVGLVRIAVTAEIGDKKVPQSQLVLRSFTPAKPAAK